MTVGTFSDVAAHILSQLISLIMNTVHSKKKGIDCIEDLLLNVLHHYFDILLSTSQKVLHQA